MAVGTNPKPWSWRWRYDRFACSPFVMPTAMRFGRTTRERESRNQRLQMRKRRKRLKVASFVVPVALALVAGCERETANDAARTSDANLAAPNARPKASADTIQTGTDSKASMVQVAGGRFTMGDKNEVDAPLHEVVVGPFFIDKHLVTQEQFQTVMGSNPSRWKGDKNPVEQVRWSDAVRFCNRRSELEGFQPGYDLQNWKCNFDANGYRLPTEAEWEYACRAGTTTPYFFGDSPAKLGA